MIQDDEARWAELMARAQAGDQPAYEQLLTELGKAIAAYLYSRFGAMRLLEDCVQDSLLAVHVGRHSYLPGRRFRPWLFAIVRYRAIDMLRRERTQSAALDRDVDVDTVHVQVAADESRTANLETAGSVLAALASRHREVLILTKIMGFSIAEAAGQLGISEGAMKVRVHRATRAATRMLEAERE